jgi:hypothetical protein
MAEKKSKGKKNEKTSVNGKWVDEARAFECFVCQKAFGIMLGKHHCKVRQIALFAPEFRHLS